MTENTDDAGTQAGTAFEAVGGEAREALVQFLAEATTKGWRCVRVVHGKGHGSPGRLPVLKAKVRHWLMQRLDVLAFIQARGPDGGAGALIVLLDPPRLGR